MAFLQVGNHSFGFSMTWELRNHGFGFLTILKHDFDFNLEIMTHKTTILFFYGEVQWIIITPSGAWKSILI